MKKIILSLFLFASIVSCKAQNMSNFPTATTPISTDLFGIYEPANTGWGLAGLNHTYKISLANLSIAVGKQLGIAQYRIPLGNGTGALFTSSANFQYNPTTNSFGFGDLLKTSANFDNVGRTWYILDDIFGTPRGIFYNGISNAFGGTCNGLTMDYGGRTPETGFFALGATSAGGSYISIDGDIAGTSFDIKLATAGINKIAAHVTPGNTSIGYRAGEGAGEGNYFGGNAGLSSSGIDNNFFGYGAGWLSVGDNNNGFGFTALSPNAGDRNSAIGEDCIGNSVGSNNSACGYFALNQNNGSNNCALGDRALQLNVANNVIGIGKMAGHSNAIPNSIFLNVNGLSTSDSTNTIIYGHDGVTDGLLTEVKINATLVVGYNVVPEPTAILQAESTTKGFLPPRMTTVQILAITSPAEGLVAYDITLHKLFVFDGTIWQAAW